MITVAELELLLVENEQKRIELEAEKRVVERLLAIASPKAEDTPTEDLAHEESSYSGTNMIG